MLKALSIKGLFNLYSYKLEFYSGDGLPMKFITGPNGYGKTTVLELIYALYKGEIRKFVEIPFERIEFFFDEVKVILRQSRINEMMENSDEGILKVHLGIELKKSVDDSLVQKIDFDASELVDGDEWVGGFAKSLKLYFNAQSCYFIKDQRLERKLSRIDEKEEDVSNIRKNAARFKVLLEQKEKEIMALFNKNFAECSMAGTSLSEDDYETERMQLEETIGMLNKVGIFLPVALMKGSKEMLPVQSVYLIALKKTIDEHKNFIDRVNAFKTIMHRSKFAHKQFQIDKRFGYRFMADDELKSILHLDALSSGEKHILIQTYELLFEAENGALVLIDEPEMSFHMMWQIDYLKNMEIIAGLRNIQCIISTHSPQIFSRKWNLTIDLFEQAEKS